MKYRTDNGSKLIEMIHNGTIQKDTLRYHDADYYRMNGCPIVGKLEKLRSGENRVTLFEDQISGNRNK